MAQVADPSSSISLSELRSELSLVEPRAFLVPLRILRRVIRAEAGLGRFGTHLPHRKTFILTGERARELLAPDELGLNSPSEFPDWVILVIRPDPDKLETLSRTQILQRYWRLLFHARVHLAFEALALGRSDLDSRIETLGRLEFEEVRTVLDEERFLLPGASDRSVYIEFAAVFLELKAFAPHAIRAYFPSLASGNSAETRLGTDIDFEKILAETNLGGVPLPQPLVHVEYEAEDLDSDEHVAVAGSGSEAGHERRWQDLMDRAEARFEVGNSVRAAILRTQAIEFAPRSERGRTLALARSALDALVRRLRLAIDLSDSEATHWRKALRPLLERSARGLWPREARLLYDLQMIGLEREKEVYSVDLFGWALSLGKRPLKRLLPHHREVRVVKHLRAASRRLRRVRLAEIERQTLGRLLDRAIHQAENRLRERFRPLIIGTMDENGVAPKNLPERAARRKLIEELLDRIIENGFLRFGDLRDAFSRSQVKLPDLAGPVEFVRGDRLLKTDRGLSRSLEGVYRRGEIYMRALQRFSSLFFGTPAGRFLTLFLILPVGGAFVILERLKHLVAIFVHAFHGVEPELLNPITWAVLSLMIAGAVNSRTYRHQLWAWVVRIAKGVKFLFFDIPRWLFHQRLIRSIVQSRAFRVTWNWAIKPAIVGAVIWALLPVDRLEYWIEHRESSVGRFFLGRHNLLHLVGLVLLSLVINSRPGRDFEEVVADGFARLSRRFRVEFLAGLLRFIMDFFAGLMEMVERILYAVDERLRFRTGEGRFSLISKGLVGVVWFAVTYVARIYINLLIEPQINPIKHFPVVTVSHKIILPMTLQITRVVSAPLMPLGTIAANTIAVVTVFLLPGVFGFLVWEFKENWKLYESNRSRNLNPERIGHHGETLRGLLRPGFHSGTIPRLFARWRKAERKAQRQGRPAFARKSREALHHVEATIGHYFDRAMIYLLEETRSVDARKLTIGPVHLATNRIHVDLRHADRPDAARISFEERAGELHVRFDELGWLRSIDPSTRQTLSTALTGIYVMSQVERLDDGTPHDFSGVVVSWKNWVRAWEADWAGEGHPDRVAEGVRILESPGVRQSPV